MNMEYITCSSVRNFTKTLTASTLLFGATIGYFEYKDNLEVNRTKKTMSSLGLEYMNAVRSKDPSILPLTKKYHQEIQGIIKNAERSMMEKKIYTQQLEKIETDFLKSHDLGLRKDLELIHTGTEKGYGVLATHSIPVDNLIGIYAGDIRHTSEIENHDYAFDCLCLDSPSPEVIVLGEMQIDATKSGNITRFINAPSPGHKGNCTALNLLDREQIPQVVFVTNCDIKSGEELTIDYGSKYPWKNKRV